MDTIKQFQNELISENLHPLLPGSSEFDLATKPTNGLKKLSFEPCALIRVMENEEISKAVKLAKTYKYHNFKARYDRENVFNSIHSVKLPNGLNDSRSVIEE